MTGAAPHFRLFIAIALPEPVKAEIERAQAELRRALPGGLVRWTKREQFHLTLRFLGNVEAAKTDPLVRAVRNACAACPSLSLRSERIGFFPDHRYPRVMWVSIHDEQKQLPLLQRAIVSATETFTFEAPEKEFTAHVTLGRIQRIKRPQAEQLATLAARVGERCFGEWTAGYVDIMRSELSPAGARHACLAAIPLAR
jgi:RNA 2',3'-cyclic 3'-phosphodiesterase